MEIETKILRLTQSIRNEAISLGFLECGFSKVRELSDISGKYLHWIASSYHAGMNYMEKNIDKRLNPALLVDNSKSVISLLYNYYSPESLTQSRYQISKYAYGGDYHDIIKEKLQHLEAYIRGLVPDVEQRCFVDSAPVMERVWAQEGGLGWIGKNSCLISRKHGSFFFIAEIITSLELEYNTPGKDFCGNCSKCIDACPTNAIKEGKLIDSNRCISYQTVENKGSIPENLTGKFNQYIFGCDICQNVCPWNKFSKIHNEPGFKLSDAVRNMTDEDWKTLTEERFKELFRKSAFKRTKFQGLKRNILFVNQNLSNTGSKV